MQKYCNTIIDKEAKSMNKWFLSDEKYFLEFFLSQKRFILLY